MSEDIFEWDGPYNRWIEIREMLEMQRKFTKKPRELAVYTEGCKWPQGYDPNESQTD